MSPRPPRKKRLRALVRELTDGVSQAELRRLFDRDASQAWAVLTRDETEPLPEGDWQRFWYRVRVLFLGIAHKLSPPRRLLFALSILLFLLSPLSMSWKVRTVVVSLDLGILAFLGFGCLLFLFALELVDKVLVRDELEVARQLQAELLPQEVPPLPGYAVAHSYRTANEVGGDYYDFQPLPGGRLALVVGDASGHGMAAGLVMAIANSTWRTVLDIDPAPERVHELLNRTLCRTSDRRTFMSLFYGLLQLDSGAMELCLAGHPYPLLRHASGEIVELGEGGLPLGLKEALEPRCQAVQLAPGDLLLLYSDGLPEALDAAGEAFGFERLRQLLAGGGTAEQVHQRVLAAFDRHVGGEALRDDLTLVVVERQPQRNLAPPPPPPPPPPSQPG